MLQHHLGAIMITRREAALGAMALLFPGAAMADDVLRIPLHMTGGRPTVKVTINGRGPYLFAINAGQGASFVERPVSNRAKLRIIGDQFEASTILSSTETIIAHRVNAAKIVVGDVFTLKNVSMFRTPQLFPNDIPDVFGMLGRQLFVQKDCVLDFEKAEIRVYPNGFTPTEGFRQVEAKIGTSPTSTYGITLDAELNQKPLRLALNTWIGEQIRLSPDYVLANRLWPATADYANAPGQPVIGGRIIENTTFRMGPFVFDEVSLMLYPPDTGSHMADFGIDAYIGLGLMKMFSLAFVGGKTIFLKPNASANRGWDVLP